jgi:hypothetical protein
VDVFREMDLRGEPDRLEALMEMASRNLPPGWSRDLALEGRLKARSFDEGRRCYCFRAEHLDFLPNADLFVIEIDDRTLKVSNIVPRNQAQLSIGQYNALLEEFADRIVRPYADQAGVTIELTSKHFDLDELLSKTAVRKLLAFTAGPDVETTASRKDNRRRWLDFIVTAHQDGKRLPARVLRRWLIEVGGWDPDEADRLAAEYDFGAEVLDFTRSQTTGV